IPSALSFSPNDRAYVREEPMPFTEYVEYDGVGLADLIARREVTTLEVIDAAIARAEELDPRLNAIVYRTFDHARQPARHALPDTPFRGFPFLLKDTLARTPEAPPRSASAFMPAAPAPYDAELTARFRRAGLISLGKTNAPEFGLLPITESKLYGAAYN